MQIYSRKLALVRKNSFEVCPLEHYIYIPDTAEENYIVPNVPKKFELFRNRLFYI